MTLEWEAECLGEVEVTLVWYVDDRGDIWTPNEARSSASVGAFPRERGEPAETWLVVVVVCCPPPGEPV